MQNSYSEGTAQNAGFWVRLAAYTIDSVIVFVGLVIVRLVLAGITSAISGNVFNASILFHYTLKDIILYIFHVLYFILLTYFTGTTLGKKALNLRVVSEQEVQRLSFFDVVYRETVGRFLCSVCMGIGYIMIGLDKEKRGFHDMLCDTRVIYGKKIKIYPVYPIVQQPVPLTPEQEKV